MPADSATAPLPLVAAFAGGLPWQAGAEATLGLCAACSACVPEWWRAQVRHSLEALVRQGVS